MGKTNKSVLVIDTPECCNECKLCYHEYYITHTETYCTVHKSDVFIAVDKHIKPEWCPLSPLPEEIKLKQDEDTVYDTYSLLMRHYAKGWNEFREEILKG